MRRGKKPVIAGLAGACLLAGALCWPVDMRHAALSPVLLASDGSLLRSYAAPDGQIRLPITNTQVDPVFIQMLLAYEDRRFAYHPGVDPLALVRAGMQWLRTGQVVSGGSTLTMQVAKLLSPAPRTFGNKILEIWRALRLEVQYSKTQILDDYLVLAPYGGNLAGIRAASLVYFNKEPGHLTPDEAALLVVLPQNPNGFRPDRFPDQARQAREKLLRRLFENKAISQTAFETGMAAGMPGKRYFLPKLAPHLADFLFHTQLAASPWHSTLDAGLQSQLEKRLYAYLVSLPPKVTIAAMVIDNKTHAVKAYIGNADYFSTERAGQIDMVRAIRSPGSTLKPFAYGLAFQDGLAAPETIIRDTQTRFGNYVPSNFNQGFNGEVTLCQALQQSLNIPAVKILDKIGAQRFLAKISIADGVFKLTEQKSTAELPIILGGLGTRLWDVTQLYTAFSNKGHIRPIHYLQNDRADKTFPLLTAKAARQVTDILLDTALNNGVMRGPDTENLAIKTGTSYGYRDAWSIGYTPDYTIGVWVGRPDGTPVPGQVGRNSAIPVLLHIHDALPFCQNHFQRIAPDTHLPDNLRRWIGDRDPVNSQKRLGFSSLSIHYPVNNSQYRLSDIREHGLKLLAQGGTKPYQWYVNGEQIIAQGKDFIWTPASAGFYKLTVQDDNRNMVYKHLTVVE